MHLWGAWSANCFLGPLTRGTRDCITLTFLLNSLLSSADGERGHLTMSPVVEFFPGIGSFSTALLGRIGSVLILAIFRLSGLGSAKPLLSARKERRGRLRRRHCSSLVIGRVASRSRLVALSSSSARPSARARASASVRPFLLIHSSANSFCTFSIIFLPTFTFTMNFVIVTDMSC